MLNAYLDRICASAQYSNFGPIHEEFARSVCNTLTADHALLFTNATLALTTVMRAARIGGEVITTPFSFAASAHAISWADAKPVFVDIDERTLTLDPRAVEAAITERTQAILAVHVYGTICDVKALQAVAKKHGLFLIFDAAHAWDVRLDGVPVHRFGDATIYSLHASKLMHSGEGGVLVCNDTTIASLARRLQNFGIESDGSINVPGSNGKLSELHAALGLSVLPKVDAEKAKRRLLRETYVERLREFDWLQPIAPTERATESLQYFALQVLSEQTEPANNRRDRLCAALAEVNVQSRKYFYPLCSDFPHYQSTTTDSKRDLAVAQRAAQQALCLPFHSGVETHAIDQIVASARRLN